MEEDTDHYQPTVDPEFAKIAGARVEPLLKHLNVEGVELNKNQIRENFIGIWEMEDGENLPAEEQYLTTVALFMYTSHNFLIDCNVRQDRARTAIVSALRIWIGEKLEKEVAAERATENPFKTFVDTNVPKVDEIYTWKHFQLDHKKADENEWTYKMKACWFTEWFVRFGRVDYIETACMFDQLPHEARKDYVDLKLDNKFMKLGSYCQFKYTPAKKDT